MPIWMKDPMLLNLKGAKKEDSKVQMNGVGGITTGDLYRVNFDFGDIHFRNMPIVYKEIRAADAYMLLPFSIFEGMIIEFNDINHTFTLKVDSTRYYRELRLKDKHGKPQIYLAGTYSTEEEFQRCNPDA